MRQVMAGLILLFASCSVAAAQSVTGAWAGTWSWTACPPQWPCDGVQHTETFNLLQTGADITGSGQFEISYVVTGTLSGSTLNLTLTPTSPIGDLHSTCVLQVIASQMSGPCTQSWNGLSGSWSLTAYQNPLTSDSFSPVTWYDAGANNSYALAVGDLDNDGFDDIVVSNQRYEQGVDHHTGVAIYINNGDGTFRQGPRYPTDGFAANPWQSVEIGDVDGDGKPDLVVLNSANACCQPIQVPSVSVMRGNGDGTFQTAVSYLLSIYPNTQVSPGKLTVADVNGDGKPDVLVAGTINGVDGLRGGVSVLLNNGNGTFADAVLYDSGGYIAAPTVMTADVNRDGFSDVVVSNVCSVRGNAPPGYLCYQQDGAGNLTRIPGTVGVLLGNGDGTFQTAATYASGGIVPGALVATDLNRDGRLDLLVEHAACFQCAGTTTAVLIGNGDGSFQAPVSYNNGASTPVSVGAGDMDGDGFVDAIVMSYCALFQSCAGDTGTLSVLRGNGDGTLQGPSLYSLWAVNGLGYAPHSVVVRDLDNDGKPDVVVMGWTSFGVLLNQTLRAATTTDLVSLPTPSIHGQPVTFTATVSSAAPGVPTGTVTFSERAAILATVPLVDGAATLEVAGLVVGAHAIVATYSSDDAFRASASAPLTHVVTEPALASFIVSPASGVGGRKAKGTVTLTRAAPPGGAVVILASGNPAAPIPASIKIAAGATSKTFTITTKPVATTTGPFDISASYRGVTLRAPLTVLQAVVSKVTITPASVSGGAAVKGKVMLTGAAPAGGASVALASANPAAVVAATVIVPAGATSAPFAVTTVPFATKQGPFVVSATYNGVTKSDSLTVTAPRVLSVVLNPPNVAGGGLSIGTVTLTGPAPPEGMTVTLKSSKVGVATVPLSVTVPATSTSAPFAITTRPVSATSTATIAATAGGATKNARLTVTP